MKKLVVIFSLIILCANVDSQIFNGGLIIGPVSSQVDGDNLAGYKKAGLQFGGWTSYDFNNKWSGQFEIKYIMKGSHKPKNLNTGDYTRYMMQLNYIDFPILASYNLHPDIQLNMGIIPALLISYQESDEVGDFESDPSRPFKKVNMAGVIGVNYQFKPKIRFEFRQAMDFIPFRPHPGGQTNWYDYGQYNRWLELAVYYSFRNE